MALSQSNAAASMVDMPMQSPKEMAPQVEEVASPVNSPVNSPVKSPVNSPVKSPVKSPVNSPVNSPVTSPVNSVAQEVAPVNSVAQEGPLSPESARSNRSTKSQGSQHPLSPESVRSNRSTKSKKGPLSPESARSNRSSKSQGSQHFFPDEEESSGEFNCAMFSPKNWSGGSDERDDVLSDSEPMSPRSLCSCEEDGEEEPQTPMMSPNSIVTNEEPLSPMSMASTEPLSPTSIVSDETRSTSGGGGRRKSRNSPSPTSEKSLLVDDSDESDDDDESDWCDQSKNKGKRKKQVAFVETNPTPLSPLPLSPFSNAGSTFFSGSEASMLSPREDDDEDTLTLEDPVDSDEEEDSDDDDDTLEKKASLLSKAKNRKPGHIHAPAPKKKSRAPPPAVVDIPDDESEASLMVLMRYMGCTPVAFGEGPKKGFGAPLSPRGKEFVFDSYDDDDNSFLSVENEHEEAHHHEGEGVEMRLDDLVLRSPPMSPKSPRRKEAMEQLKQELDEQERLVETLREKQKKLLAGPTPPTSPMSQSLSAAEKANMDKLVKMMKKEKKAMAKGQKSNRPNLTVDTKRDRKIKKKLKELEALASPGSMSSPGATGSMASPRSPISNSIALASLSPVPKEEGDVLSDDDELNDFLVSNNKPNNLTVETKRERKIKKKLKKLQELEALASPGSISSPGVGSSLASPRSPISNSIALASLSPVPKGECDVLSDDELNDFLAGKKVSKKKTSKKKKKKSSATKAFAIQSLSLEDDPLAQEESTEDLLKKAAACKEAAIEARAGTPKASEKKKKNKAEGFKSPKSPGVKSPKSPGVKSPKSPAVKSPKSLAVKSPKSPKSPFASPKSSDNNAKIGSEAKKAVSPTNKQPAMPNPIDETAGVPTLIKPGQIEAERSPAVKSPKSPKSPFASPKPSGNNAKIGSEAKKAVSPTNKPAMPNPIDETAGVPTLIKPGQIEAERLIKTVADELQEQALRTLYPTKSPLGSPSNRSIGNSPRADTLNDVPSDEGEAKKAALRDFAKLEKSPSSRSDKENGSSTETTRIEAAMSKMKSLTVDTSGQGSAMSKMKSLTVDTSGQGSAIASEVLSPSKKSVKEVDELLSKTRQWLVKHNETQQTRRALPTPTGSITPSLGSTTPSLLATTPSDRRVMGNITAKTSLNTEHPSLNLGGASAGSKGPLSPQTMDRLLEIRKANGSGGNTSSAASLLGSASSTSAGTPKKSIMEQLAEIRAKQQVIEARQLKAKQTKATKA